MITTVIQVIGAAVAAAGGVAGVTAFLKIGPERRKINAQVYRAGVDSAQVLSNSAVSLLQPSLDQIKFLREELASARSEITSLRIELANMQSQVTMLTTGYTAS
jgi:hypothetical protein